MKLLRLCLIVMLSCFVITACSPEVGSDEWCEAMKKKPRGDWTVDEIGDFTKYCIFKSTEQ